MSDRLRLVVKLFYIKRKFSILTPYVVGLENENFLSAVKFLLTFPSYALLWANSLSRVSLSEIFSSKQFLLVISLLWVYSPLGEFFIFDPASYAGLENGKFSFL